jgi:K+/H+ antiporter YhaU regulatory subunit KhtT
MRLATSSERIDLAAEQVEIAAHTRFVGKSIRDANLRQEFGVIVVAIKRVAGHMEFNPSPEVVIYAGDQLVVLGHSDQLRNLEAAATGSQRTEPAAT